MGSLDGLLHSLKAFDPDGRANVVFLVSFDGMPVDLSDTDTAEKLVYELGFFRERHKATAFQISLKDS